MNPPIPYAFPVRALRRWRDERLGLAADEAGGWRATFHFEGSTCGNIPFALRFEVGLDAAGILRELRCAPAPADEGHARMCSYLEDAERLLAELATQAPLRGRPLADVLTWNPATSPAGCVCAPASRAHKWLAVLQTLHFALHAPAAPAATSASPPAPAVVPANEQTSTSPVPATHLSAS